MSYNTSIMQYLGSLEEFSNGAWGHCMIQETEMYQYSQVRTKSVEEKRWQSTM